MANKEYRIVVDPAKVRAGVRDEAIKALITRNGGAVRVFPDKRRQERADKVGRKAKYKGGYE